MSDDKPAIDYHPFGTITLNFDDGPVKLRRCRLGDVRYAKDLLAELRTDIADRVQSWADQINQNREGFPGPELSDSERTAFFAGLSAEQRADLNAKLAAINTLNESIQSTNRDSVYKWLEPVAKRMGDAPLPPMEDWPLEILDARITDFIEHWQTHPLASGKTLGQNRTTLEAANSGPHQPAASSPPAQP